MKPSIGCPLTNAITAGIDWMPICCGICGCLSMSILTSFTLPLAALTTFSMIGRELLAGAAPVGDEIDHHGLLLGRLDHVRHEGLGGGFLDEVAGGGRRGAVGLQQAHAGSSSGGRAGRRPANLIGLNGLDRRPNAMPQRFSGSLATASCAAGGRLPRGSAAGRRGRCAVVIVLIERMIVQRFVPHHGFVEHDVDAPFRIVDGAERRHRAGFDAPDSAQQVGGAERKAAGRAERACRLLSGICASSCATTRKSAPFLSLRNKFLVWPPGMLPRSALRFRHREQRPGARMWHARCPGRSRKAKRSAGVFIASPGEFRMP